jgi:DHA1 family tetracycline resistance protein-like MFS transporter
MQDTSPPPTPAEAPTSAPSNRSALLIVFLVVFIDLLGFGIVLPLLPRIGDEYVAALVEGGKTSPLGGPILGALMASFSLMQFVAAPLWGRLSDRVGRRPILLVGLTGSVVFYALLGFACSLPDQQAGLALTLLFISRLGAGLAGATIATAQAVIADCTPPDKRKHGMALIGAAFGIGFTFGPLVGALAMAVAPHHHEAVGYTAAVLSLVALGLGLRLLPETRQFDRTSAAKRNWVDRSALRHALANPAVGPVILVFFLASLGFAAFETTLALFLQTSLQLAEDKSYLIFAYVGFVLMLTQGFLYRRLARRLSEATFMVLGIVHMALGLAGLAAVTVLAEQVDVNWAITMVLVFLSLGVAVVGFAFMTPSAQALISRRTDASQQGEILGVNQSASAMARILGPPLGISLFKLTDPPVLPYVFGAVVLLAMLPIMPRIRRGGIAPTPLAGVERGS